QQPGCRRDRINDPKRRRVRRHRPQQGVLISHRSEIGEAIAAIGKHHRQITHHTARIMTRPPRLEVRKAHRQSPREPAFVALLLLPWVTVSGVER
ncbi:MAG: hypothetical protein LC777_18520, partial [Actinobacteria bacterium]|nr:hypothetical protein [Actinomycetota bacterium]